MNNLELHTRQAATARLLRTAAFPRVSAGGRSLRLRHRGNKLGTSIAATPSNMPGISSTSIKAAPIHTAATVASFELNSFWSAGWFCFAVCPKLVAVFVAVFAAV